MHAPPPSGHGGSAPEGGSGSRGEGQEHGHGDDQTLDERGKRALETARSIGRRAAAGLTGLLVVGVALSLFLKSPNVSFVLFTLAAAFVSVFGAAAQTDVAWIKFHGQEGNPEAQVHHGFRWAVASGAAVLGHAFKGIARRPRQLPFRVREAGGVALRFLGTVLTLCAVCIAYFSGRY